MCVYKCGMAMRSSEDEDTHDITPNPKRRKLDHIRVGRQDESEHSSFPNHETEGNADHSPERLNLGVLMQEKSSASTNKTRESKSTTLYTGDLNRSSMFKLQVDEMLRVVQPNYAKLMEPMDKALRKLKVLIEGIEDRDPVTVGLFPSRV